MFPTVLQEQTYEKNSYSCPYAIEKNRFVVLWDFVAADCVERTVSEDGGRGDAGERAKTKWRWKDKNSPLSTSSDAGRGE